LCLGYWALITLLLLMPRPEMLVPARLVALKYGVHTTAFLTLTLVTLFVRWPQRPGWLLALPVGYAVMAESLQHFFPPRSVQLVDLCENLLGIVLGSGLYWVAVAVFASRSRRRRRVALAEQVIVALPRRAL
jgi:Na+/proline symporter